MANITTNPSAETLSLVTHNQVPVVTTELLAQLYGTDVDNIRQNFNRNTERFIEGKHFFKLTGEQLKEFRLSVTNCHAQISNKTRYLTLWTERGAARHAKMLDTDQAWDVFETLEDCYFSKEQKVQTPFNLAETLSQTLNQISKGNKKLYMSMYNGLSRCFAVSRLADIPHAEIHNALATIYLYAVEWHRKNDHTQLPLKLNDGEHYLVVKNGVVLWERKLKPHCNDIPANTLQNPKLMLEHIREVAGEFIGKETLPAPKPILVADFPKKSVFEHKNQAQRYLLSLDVFYDGYGLQGNPLRRLFALLKQAKKDGTTVTVNDIEGAELVFSTTESLARQYQQSLNDLSKYANNASIHACFLPIHGC